MKDLGSAHVHERRGASSPVVLLQSCFSHTCMVSLCLLPLTCAQEAAACLPCQTETRPRSIEKASKAKNKKKPNHILLPADKAISAGTGLEGSGVSTAQTYWDQFKPLLGGKSESEKDLSSWDTGKTHSFLFRTPKMVHSYCSQGLHKFTDHFETGDRSLSTVEIPWTTL